MMLARLTPVQHIIAMRYALVLCGVYLLACTSAKVPRSAPAVAEPALQREIAARVATDQAVQQELGQRIQSGQQIGPADYARRDSVFGANLDWMRIVLHRYGWPGWHLVGEAGSHGAWLLLQHADKDTTLQRTALALLDRAVRARDASPQDYAYLTDRMRVAEGRPQVYGTQLQYDNQGCASIKTSESPAELDSRRASMGLSSVADYLHTTMVALGRAARCETTK
jgi:hypothetical protein